MTKEILYSPGFGAGWATWNSEYGKALAEDSILIELVKTDKHKGTTPYTGEMMAGTDTPSHREFMAHKCSPDFYARACAIAREHGAEADWHPYCGGVPSLVVRTVSGPYRIDEYDGSESVVEAAEETWW